MASDRDWEHGHDDALLELERGLDQLRVLAIDISHTTITQLETAMIASFLQLFSNHDFYPAVVVSLLVRIALRVSTGQSLPSGRTVNQLTEALGSVAFVPPAMSSGDESSFMHDDDSFDEDFSVSTTADDGLLESEERDLLTMDHVLRDAISRCDSQTVQLALKFGADVNAVRNDRTPLLEACKRGDDQIIRILLDAGADARWRNRHFLSAITKACYGGHLSIVQLLINHDNGLLEFEDSVGQTPLINAIRREHSDIVRFLLDQGADAHHIDENDYTALMHACERGSLEIVWLLLHAGADVEARIRSQRTALHHAARYGTSRVVFDLILHHNANMFAVDEDGRTPFDLTCCARRSNTYVIANLMLFVYGHKVTQDHGRLALHELLKVAEYSFVEDEWFHPPLYPLKTILPLGKLTLKHWCTLLESLDTEAIRNRDESIPIHNRDATGRLPIHIACRTGAPEDVLAMLSEIDPATLHMADHAGSLPVHLCCSGTAEYSSVLYLVAQGGVGTLAARDHQGALPLHVLCGSTNPSLRTVQYLIQSFPGSVAMRTNAGQYPFMVAASDSSSASLSVVYELVRANPGLVVPG